MNTEVRVTRQLGLSVRLSINQKNCTAGGLIRGKILMFVPQHGSYDLSGIHVSLVGRENVVVYRPQSAAATSSTREVVRVSAEVVRLPSQLKAGQYEYPFCWQLPADETLPVTMSCNKGASSCHVKYNLTAYLPSRKNSEPHDKEPEIFSTKPICVIGSGRRIKDNNNYCDENNTTIKQEPQIVEVKSWQKTRGCIELGLETNTSFASPNSLIAVGITGRGNLSCAPVKKLLIKWVETVHWGQKREDECLHRRVLAQTTIAVNNSPRWQARKNKTMENTESTALANTTHGANVMRYLYLNNSARDSYEGHLIKVQHSINVMAVTRGRFVTNAEFTTRMQVHRQQLRQSEYGASPRNTPIMASAQLSPLTAKAGSIDNSNDLAGKENQILSDIEIPEAVPVNGDVHHTLVCPIVQGEMEQHPPTCCSTENTLAYLGSSSPPHIMSQPEMLQTALVLDVVSLE